MGSLQAPSGSGSSGTHGAFCTPTLPLIQCVGAASHISKLPCSSPAGFGQDPVAGSSCFPCCCSESRELLVRSLGWGILGKPEQVAPWCFPPCRGGCPLGGEICHICSGDEGIWPPDTASRCPCSSPMPQLPERAPKQETPSDQHAPPPPPLLHTRPLGDGCAVSAQRCLFCSVVLCCVFSP